MALIEETEDRFYRSEEIRLRGELLIRNKPRASRRSSLTEAESRFLAASKLASRQKTKSFGLRATIGLVRLWLETGKGEETKWKLTKVYRWFTEGPDTPDFKKARSLLGKLA